MELLNRIKNQENKLYYEDFKSKLTLLKEQLKPNNKYKDILESLDSINSSKINFLLLLFQNHDIWLKMNFHDIYYKKDTFFKINKISDNKNDNDKHCNIFNVFIHWILYLYLELIKNIYSSNSINKTKINRNIYLFKETNLLIIKLYK